jgi:hypothetical protein
LSIIVVHLSGCRRLGIWRAIIGAPVNLPGAGFCIRCGAELDPGHRFCWRCGAARYEAPAAPEPPERAPPSPGTQPFAAAALPQRSPSLGWLQFFYAAGAVFWLVSLAQTAAVVANPDGRSQLSRQLAGSGIPAADLPSALIAYCVSALLLTIVAATVHGVAFYGLRAHRRWGWAAAVLLAGLWSIVLVGIPFLYVLLKPATRQAYGVD